MSSPSSSTARALGHALEQTSRELAVRARRGDLAALNELLGRHLPRLRRWAHRRLPSWARSGIDTSDLIQDAILRTLPRIGTFEPRGKRALAAYLQQTVRNRIRDEHRRIGRRGRVSPLVETLIDARPSPFDEAVARDTEVRYRAALASISSVDRELIVAHVELDYTHEQLGCMTGRSPHAARMALHRAIRRLAERMGDG